MEQETHNTKWKSDPTKGQVEVQRRRDEILGRLKDAADIAVFAIDEDLEIAIEKLRKSAGEKKSAIQKSIEKSMSAPLMELVRKYWNEDPNAMWKNFIHNMSENSGKP